ncbi:hypothetical protein FHS30_000632 [Simiduia aestuariiviva]|uniref:Uncharacterized protein n=1 Tax=Simiduia aestuariiviva TaxID=1510459 RepID=A0A839UNX9_9GAMM|nr:hypothetical protein [Simiduia aestuariiviva]
MNFDALNPEVDYCPVDITICAIGCTRKQAGSNEQFIRDDKGISLEVAALVKKPMQFALVLCQYWAPRPAIEFI